MCPRSFQDISWHRNLNFFNWEQHKQTKSYCGLDIIPSMTIGMGYGTLVMLIYTIAQSNPFVLPKSIIYWASLLYLIIPGSIVAFLCYLTLIKNIGPELAGYTTILFPVVALIVSWMLEGYEGSLADLIGLSLVICGNILVMAKKPLNRYVS